MSNESIPYLLGRISLKDRTAFVRLYEIASPKLFGVCFRILRDKQDAEEALQDVFIKVWQRADSYVEGKAGAQAWLCAIARNQAIDRIRSRKPASTSIDDAYDLADPRIDPEQAVLMRSEGRRIDGCMERLPSERAAAVRSAYVDGYSYGELAERFGVPLNTMRTWLRRSLIKLKECLSQ